jgi:hypothetical protein
LGRRRRHRDVAAQRVGVSVDSIVDDVAHFMRISAGFRVVSAAAGVADGSVCVGIKELPFQNMATVFLQKIVDAFNNALTAPPQLSVVKPRDLCAHLVQHSGSGERSGMEVKGMPDHLLRWGNEGDAADISWEQKAPGLLVGAGSGSARQPKDELKLQLVGLSDEMAMRATAPGSAAAATGGAAGAGGANRGVAAAGILFDGIAFEGVYLEAGGPSASLRFKMTGRRVASDGVDPYLPGPRWVARRIVRTLLSVRPPLRAAGEPAVLACTSAGAAEDAWADTDDAETFNAATVAHERKEWARRLGVDGPRGYGVSLTNRLD